VQNRHVGHPKLSSMTNSCATGRLRYNVTKAGNVPATTEFGAVFALQLPSAIFAQDSRQARDYQ
jgi:hypothetical protein